MKKRFYVTASVLAFALCACGGGGGGAGGGSSIVPTTPPSTTPGSPASSQSVKFVISVPSATTTSALRRKPAYVSSNTGSVRITLQSVNGAPPSSPSVTVAPISATAPGCSTDSQKNINCTITIEAPAGLDLFAIATYQSSDASGAILASTTVSANAGSTAVSSVPLSLGGVPARVTFSPSQLPMVNDGAIHRYAVTLNAADASGATIVGASNYQSPVSLQILNDPAHALTLSTTSVIQPGTVVTVTYNSSKALTQGQIVASDNAMPAASLNAVPLNVTPTPVVLFDDALSSAVTFSEAGFTGNYAVSLSNPNDATLSVTRGPLNSGSAVASIVPKTRFDVTNLNVSDGNVTDAITVSIVPHNGSYTAFGNKQAILPPFGMVQAADGTFWTGDTLTGSLVQFNPSTGTFTSHVVDPGLSGPSSVAVDSAGNVWFADRSQIGEYVVAGGTVNMYSTGLSASPNVNSIIAGPSGTMWFYDFGTNNGITHGNPTYFGSIDTSTGQIQEYQSSEAAEPNLGAMTMVLAPDNSIWFGDALNASVGRIDTSTGNITEIPVGTPAAPQQTPMQLAITPDGKIWMACYSSTSGSSVIASLDPKNNNAIKYYTQGLAPGYMWALTIGSDGNLWFAEDPTIGGFRSNQMLLGVVNPNTGAIYLYPPIVPSDAQITALINGGNGTLWMLDSGFGQIGKVTFK